MDGGGASHTGNDTYPILLRCKSFMVRELASEVQVGIKSLEQGPAGACTETDLTNAVGKRYRVSDFQSDKK